MGPKEAKMCVAFEIVKMMHGEKAAKDAEKSFEKLFSKKEIPDDIPELKLKSKTISALDLAMASGALKSKSDARRLIEQGGFECGGETVKDPSKILVLKGKEVVRVGKKHFFRVTL
jgi:tyrosyl-tRNA synthetase